MIASRPTATGTVHRGRLRGDRIGASILVAACEAVGVQPDRAGVRLRGFVLRGEPKGVDGMPDVLFDVAVTAEE